MSHKNDEILDDLCFSYLLSIENLPRWAHKYKLERLMRRFPDHAQALLNYAATHSVMSIMEELNINVHDTTDGQHSPL